MACRVGIGLTAKIGGNLAQPFPSVKKDGFGGGQYLIDIQVRSAYTFPDKKQCPIKKIKK
jgi:hypothetical protein